MTLRILVSLFVVLLVIDPAECAEAFVDPAPRTIAIQRGWDKDLRTDENPAEENLDHRLHRSH